MFVSVAVKKDQEKKHASVTLQKLIVPGLTDETFWSSMYIITYTLLSKESHSFLFSLYPFSPSPAAASVGWV